MHDLQCRLVYVSNPNNSTPHVKQYSHNHSMAELHYISAGQCTFLVDSLARPVRAGQMILIPPGSYHYLRDSSPDFSRVTVSIQFRQPTSSQNNGFATQAYSAFSPSTPLLLNIHQTSTTASIFSQMGLLSLSQGLVSQEKLRALSQLLVLELFDCISCAQPTTIPVSTTPPTPQNYLIDEFFVHCHHLKNGEAQLAQRLHVSTRQLNRILKQTYGMNYREKLKEVRLTLALEQLRHTDRSILQVAQQLGYSSSANFNTFIKSTTGKTPTQLRREARLFL